MATYPVDAYNPVMDFYKRIPEGLKDKAKGILSSFAEKYKEGEAPPDKMLNSLRSLVAKESGLESKVNVASQQKGSALDRFFAGIGRILPTRTHRYVTASALGAALLYLL